MHKVLICDGIYEAVEKTDVNDPLGHTVERVTNFIFPYNLDKIFVQHIFV
jgi:hypothetical protein